MMPSSRRGLPFRPFLIAACALAVVGAALSRALVAAVVFACLGASILALGEGASAWPGLPPWRKALAIACLVVAAAALVALLARG